MRSLVIDDERLARLELSQLLQAHPDIQVVAECSNADEAADKIREHQPDLIFLDIQMPGRNGFELLEMLDKVPEVIFVTAYDDYALKAFEVSALDYLLKPIEEHRLTEALNKVRNQLAQMGGESDAPETVLGGKDQVFVKDGERCWFVTLSDVRLFESEGNYVRVYFQEHKPLILKSLNNLDKRLDPKDFFRASRKHIINLKWVDNIESWFNGGLIVTLKQGEKVEISRRQAVKLKERMSL
ncbi:MAG: response regulator [Bacteroidota bacterium]